MSSAPVWMSSVTTGNLVLKTRIALVIRNVEIVQQALDAVKDERTTLRKVLLFPSKISHSVESLRKRLAQAQGNYDNDEWSAFDDNMERLRNGLTALGMDIDELKAPADKLRTAIALGDVELSRIRVATTIQESLKETISTEFGYELEKLTSLHASVITAAPSNGTSPAGLADAWRMYTGDLWSSSVRLFGEYVDLVSGVALRDTGFDRGISRLAEDLLKDGKTIGNFTWNALTIPARDEALAVTAARIVRLGFPEWTIWTLPLAAYELGSNYADSDKKVADRLAAHGGDREELLVLVADAFATYLLGPAYACAAMLMRLNPAEAFASGRLVAKRAAIILIVLRRMSSGGGGVSDYLRNVIGRLADEWCEALLQTGWNGHIADQGINDGAPPDAEFEKVRIRTGLMVSEMVAIDKLIKLFEPLISAWIVFDVEMWPAVEMAAKKLRNGEDLGTQDLPANAQQRFLVNAAWRARIAAVDGEKDIEEPERLTKIATVVKDHMQALITASTEGGKGGEPSRLNPPRPASARGFSRRQPGEEMP